MAKYIEIEGIPDLIEFPDDMDDAAIDETLESADFGYGILRDYGVLLKDPNSIDDWEITKGLKSGKAGVGGAFAGALGVLGQKLGNKDIVDWSKETMREFEFDRLQSMGQNPTLESIGAESIQDFITSPEKIDAFSNWALYNFGNGAATTVPALLGGAMMGAPVPGARVVGMGLLYGYAGTMGAGETFQQGLEEGLSEEESANLALAVAGPYALAEKIGIGQMGKEAVGRLFQEGMEVGARTARNIAGKSVGEATAEAAQAQTKKAAKVPDFIKRMGKGFLEGAAREAATEALQESMVSGAVRGYKGEKFWSDPEFWKRTGEAAAAGGIAGGGLGGIVSTLTPTPKKTFIDDVSPEDLAKSAQVSSVKDSPDKGKKVNHGGQKWVYQGEVNDDSGNVVVTEPGKPEKAKTIKGDDFEFVEETQQNPQTPEQSAEQELEDTTNNLPSEEQEKVDSPPTNSVPPGTVEEQLEEDAPLPDDLYQPEDPNSEYYYEDAFVDESDLSIEEQEQLQSQSIQQDEEIPFDLDSDGTLVDNPIPTESQKNLAQKLEDADKMEVLPEDTQVAESYKRDLRDMGQEAQRLMRAATPIKNPMWEAPIKMNDQMSKQEISRIRKENDERAKTPEYITTGAQEDASKELTKLEVKFEKVLGKLAALRTRVYIGEDLSQMPVADLQMVERSLLEQLRKYQQYSDGLLIDMYIDEIMSQETKQTAGELRVSILQLNQLLQTAQEETLNLTSRDGTILDSPVAEEELLFVDQLRPDPKQTPFNVLKQTALRMNSDLSDLGFEAQNAYAATIDEMQDTPSNRELLADDIAEMRKQKNPRGTIVYSTTKGTPLPNVSDIKRARLVDALDELRTELNRIGLGHIGLELFNDMANPNIEGKYTKSSQVISVALGATDRLGTLKHEVIHALKDLGLFSDKEWAILRRRAKHWRDLYRVEERYSKFGLTEEQLDEEAIAIAYEMYHRNVPDQLKRKAQAANRLVKKEMGLFSRIRTVFLEIKSAFFNKGIRSADEIFDSIERGDVGGRMSDPNWNIPMPHTYQNKARPTATERTKNMHRWLGNSIVRNPNGTPKPVVHLTGNPDLWETLGYQFASTRDIGFHFGEPQSTNSLMTSVSDDYIRAVLDSIANDMGYSTHAEALNAAKNNPELFNTLQEFTVKLNDYYLNSGTFSMPMFIKVKNPVRLPELENWIPSNILDVLSEHSNREVIIEQHRDYVLTSGTGEIAANNSVDNISKVFTAVDRTRIKQSITGKSRNKQYEILREELKRKGFDGIVYANTTDFDINQVQDFGRFPDSYIIFDGNQAKSTQNWGTFDPSLEDVMYSVAMDGKPEDNNIDDSPSVATKEQSESQWNYLQKLYRRMVFGEGEFFSVRDLGLLSSVFNTNRMLGMINKKYGEMWSWLEKVKLDTSRMINEVTEDLRPLAQLKEKSPEAWTNYTRAMEIAMMNRKRYVPQGYDFEAASDPDTGQEYQDNFDWAKARIVFANVNDDGTPGQDGMGRGSTVKAGDVVVLEGANARAYVQTQHAFRKMLNHVRGGYMSMYAPVLNQASRMLYGEGMNDTWTTENIDRLQYDEFEQMFTDLEQIVRVTTALRGKSPTDIATKQAEYLIDLIKLQNTDTREELESKLEDYRKALDEVISNEQVNTKLSKDLQDFQSRYLEMREQAAQYIRDREQGLELPMEGVSDAALAAIENLDPNNNAIMDEYLKLHTQLKELQEGLQTANRFMQYDYMPRSRWGKYYIGVWNKIATTQVEGGPTNTYPTQRALYFEMVDFDGYPTKAMQDQLVEDRIKALYDKHPDYRDTEQYHMFHNISDKDDVRNYLKDQHLSVDMIFGLLSSSKQAQFKDMKEELNRAISGRSLGKMFQESNDVAGYELDFEKSISLYMHGMARLGSEMKYTPKAHQALQQLRGEWRSRAQKTFNYMTDPFQEFRGLRMFGFLWFLGLNFSSAVLQWFTLPQIFAPYMSMITGAKGAPTGAAEMAKALKIVTGAMAKGANVMSDDPLEFQDVFMDFNKIRDGIRGLYTNSADGDRAVDAYNEALNNGTIKQYALLEEIGFSVGEGVFGRMADTLGVRRGMNKVVQTHLVGMFSTMETAARSIAFISAYRLIDSNPKFRANAEKVLGNNKLFQSQIESKYNLDTEGLTRKEAVAMGLVEAKPEDMAAFVIDEVFGLYGKSNRAAYQTGAGAVLFQFQNYPHQMFELFYRLLSGAYGAEGRKAFAGILLSLFLTAGARGLPGADDLEELFRYLMKNIAGFDVDMTNAMKDLMRENNIDPMMGEFIEKGMFNALFNLDMQQRISFGNLPGSEIFKVAIGMRGDASDALGIPGSIFMGGASDAFELASQGRNIEAATKLMPVALRNVIEPATVWNDQGLQTRSGVQLIEPEELKYSEYAFKMLGFNPARAKRMREQEFDRKNLNEVVGPLQTRYSRRFENALYEMIKSQTEGDNDDVVSARNTLHEITAEIMEWNEEHRNQPHMLLKLNMNNIRKRVAMRLSPETRVKTVRPQARGLAYERQEWQGNY